MVDVFTLVLGIVILAIGITFIVRRERIDEHNAGRVQSRVLGKINEVLRGRSGEHPASGSSLVLGIGWTALGILGIVVSFLI